MKRGRLTTSTQVATTIERDADAIEALRRASSRASHPSVLTVGAHR